MATLSGSQVQPAPSPSRPWSGDPPQRAAARERLIEVAASCIARDGLVRTTIAAVAAEAGVSRPTVYRYFEDRDALVQDTLGRAGSDLIRRHASDLEAYSDPAEMAVEAVLLVIDEIPRDPVLRQVWNSGPLDPGPLRGITGPLGVTLGRELLRPLVASAGWEEEEADEATEVALRFVLSLFVAPGPRRSRDALRAFLERRLVPALGLRPAPGPANSRPGAAGRSRKSTRSP